MRRITLLPPEIEERRRARRATAALIVLVIVFIGLLGVLFFFQRMQLREQEDRLAAAQAELKTRQAEKAELQEFADLEATVKQKQQRLASAMSGDVAWSRLLVELSMIIPGDSWLTSFSGSAAAGGGSQPGQAAQAPKLGTLTFSAVTFDFPGVAKWITRLQEMKSLQNIWVPSATKGTLANRTVVNFGSTADLSSAAGSGRYQTTGATP
ncbi:MAG: PilN domain-containing protein [Acidimicrobiia bacterium]